MFVAESKEHHFQGKTVVDQLYLEHSSTSSNRSQGIRIRSQILKTLKSIFWLGKRFLLHIVDFDYGIKTASLLCNA